jgi:hypothetical protein
MATTTKTKAAKRANRNRELREILEERRDDLIREVQERIREALVDAALRRLGRI